MEPVQGNNARCSDDPAGLDEGVEDRADPDTVEWAQKHLGVPVVDHWWQTETGWAIAANPVGLEQLPVKIGSSSVPSPGVDLVVLDGLGEPVPAGTEGNIALRLPLPPGTLPTLWGDDQRYIDSYLSAFPGHYATGDSGVVDEDGYVFVLGRTDDVINVSGHRLSTGVLEAALAAHDGAARWRPWLRRVRAMKPHELSAELETFIAERGPITAQWPRLFDEQLAALRAKAGHEELTLAEALNLTLTAEGVETIPADWDSLVLNTSRIGVNGETATKQAQPTTITWTEKKPAEEAGQEPKVQEAPKAEAPQEPKPAPKAEADVNVAAIVAPIVAVAAIAGIGFVLANMQGFAIPGLAL